MKRYNVEDGDFLLEWQHGEWVRYEDAKDAIQDQLDKIARIEKVAQVAIDNWPTSTLFSALKTVLQICQDGTASPIATATGVERRVCQDIAERQELGVAKYGTTLEENPLPLREWLRHMYQELLDGALYAKRAMEELDK